MPSKINPHNKEKESDKYETPEWCWDIIKPYIPENKVIWEAFYLNGKSGDYLSKLGFDVIHRNEDFFLNNHGDIVVSNPPYTKNKLVLRRLKLLDKPFILLLPISIIATKYFKKIFKNEIDDNFTIFMFPKRVSFIYRGELAGSSYRQTTIFLGYKVSDKKFIYL